MNQALWLLILAGVSSGLAQFVNKKLADKPYRSTTYTLVTMLLNAAICLPFLFFDLQIPWLFLPWLIVFISVVVFALSNYLGYKALKTMSLSSASILSRTTIIFVAWLGILFLRESYSGQNYFGLLLIFLGCLIILYEKNQFRLNMGVVYVLLSSFLVAVASVLDKLILNYFSVLTYLFLNNFLVGLVFVLRKNILSDSWSLLRQHFGLVLLRSLFGTISFLLVLLVLKNNQVSQTMPVHKTLSLLIPVLMGIFLLKEKTRWPQKIFGSIISLLGIYLIY